MLAKLKALLGVGGDKEVTRLYMNAKTEREALLLLKQARERDLKKRDQAQAIVNELVSEEAALMQNGRKENITDVERMNLVRRIKSLRMEAKSHQDLIDKVYNPRMRTLGEHITSLMTILEVKEEPVPTMEQVEGMAIKARTMMGTLDDAKEVADGIGILHPAMKEAPDEETEKILVEMAELRRKDEEKKRKEKEKTAEVEKAKEAAKKKSAVKVLDAYDDMYEDSER